MSLLHTPNLPLGCSVNHCFSSSSGQPQDFKPESSQGKWKKGFTYRALELQKDKALLQCVVNQLCSISMPTFWSISI